MRTCSAGAGRSAITSHDMFARILDNVTVITQLLSPSYNLTMRMNVCCGPAWASMCPRATFLGLRLGWATIFVMPDS